MVTDSVGRRDLRPDAGAPPPRALLFDWDNTLVDTWLAIHRALAATFQAMGREPWTFEQTRARVRASARDSFPALFGARAGEAMEVFYRSFERDHLKNLRECTGAKGMLERLDAAGYYLAVISNKRGDLLRREADALDWAGVFRSLVGANDAKQDKPAVAPVEMALAPGGLRPGPETWLVGDTDIDLACAANSGCIPVLLRPDPPAPGEFPKHPPRYYFETCTALADALSQIDGTPRPRPDSEAS